MSNKRTWQVEEKLTYIKDIEFEVVEGTDVDAVLDYVISKRGMESAEDLAHELNKHPNVTVTKFPDKDYSSPREVEVEDYDLVGGE